MQEKRPEARLIALSEQIIFVRAGNFDVRETAGGHRSFSRKKDFAVNVGAVGKIAPEIHVFFFVKAFAQHVAHLTDAILLADQADFRLRRHQCVKTFLFDGVVNLICEIKSRRSFFTRINKRPPDG